jgi:hypothetical protein
MPREGFEPAIPATKWPQTYVLDHAATGIGETKPTKWIKGVTLMHQVNDTSICLHFHTPYYWTKYDYISYCEFLLQFV